MSEQGQPVQGTLLQGADGSLYFIANDELEAFKIPEDELPDEQSADTSGYDLANYEEMRAYRNWTAYASPKVSRTWMMGPTIVPAYVARWK
jgi:hypothetical protein